MINFIVNYSDVPNQYWTITICGHQFINGQLITEDEQLRAIAKMCSKEELNAFIKDCEANEEFEKCAILFEELQTRLK